MLFRLQANLPSTYKRKVKRGWGWSQGRGGGCGSVEAVDDVAGTTVKYCLWILYPAPRSTYPFLLRPPLRLLSCSSPRRTLGPEVKRGRVRFTLTRCYAVMEDFIGLPAVSAEKEEEEEEETFGSNLSNWVWLTLKAPEPSRPYLQPSLVSTDVNRNVNFGT